MRLIAQQTTESDWEWLKDSSIVIAAAGLVGIVLTAWINAMLNRRKERRERYAAMAATLAGWIEIPYMIRRRTSNDRETIDGIVDHIQKLQHQLNVDHADLRADCRWLATCRDEAQQAIQNAAKPYIDQAGRCRRSRPPQTSSSGAGDQSMHANPSKRSSTCCAGGLVGAGASTLHDERPAHSEGGFANDGDTYRSGCVAAGSAGRGRTGSVLDPGG